VTVTAGRRCVRVRTDVAAVPSCSTTPFPQLDGRRHGRHAGARRPARSPRRRLGGRRRRHAPRGSSPAAEVWSGWGPPRRSSSWPSGRPGVGPARSPSSSAWRRRRARCAALPACRPAPFAPGRRRSGSRAAAPPSAMVTPRSASGVRRAAASPDDRSHRPGAGRGHDPETAARPAGVLVLVPRSAGPSASARAWSGGAIGPRWTGRGPGGLADRGREPGRRLGPAPAPGGRARPRCARRVLPGGERADLQRGRRRDRAGPPGGESLHSHSPCPPVVVRAGRALWTAPRPGRAGGLVRRRVRGSARRRPAHRHVLRGVRAPGPLGARRPRRWPARPLVCFYDRTGRARLLACAHCGELAQCTLRRGRGQHAGRGCAARVASERPSSAPPAGGCA
jgi:hypothetical protein